MKHVVTMLALMTVTTLAYAQTIPLAEHPRPDFERAEWVNLNGPWGFRFDAGDEGLSRGWQREKADAFPRRITVPFPWGSPLSGVESEADLAWYARTIKVPAEWKGRRVFVVVGACDWTTRGWLDGEELGEHRGGYSQFEFELTPHVKWGEEQALILRVDDTNHPFKLEGKQGYGPAKGIWQTVYLEARPEHHITSIRFVPDTDASTVGVHVTLDGEAPAGAELRLRFRGGERDEVALPIEAGAREIDASVRIEDVRLWSLDDPYLYEVRAVLSAGGQDDAVNTYFGMRKISVMNMPGTDYPYIALNGKPIYLKMTLDQAYHPEGFYTYPSDAFMRDEVLRSRRIGLNANRLHVKVDVPRKLYWADKLGLLIMADIPNAWGEPDAEMRKEIEYALRQTIKRDFNHPSIFAWVPFNETWGLFSGEGKERRYLPETQDWVASIYQLAKELDPTRLVEDNSPCNHDHVETDINSWHVYAPGYDWRDHLAQVVRDTHAGSRWNFIGDRAQGSQPLLNSECGNVWGYEGSAGDVDWTWDYHIMMNEFRRQPKVCGWLYTEHHDVINEWNGYYRYDRSEKFTGLDALVEGMTLRDLHGDFYISTGSDLCRDVRPGEAVKVPLFASFMTGAAPGEVLTLRAELTGWDTLGRHTTASSTTRAIAFEPWLNRELEPLDVTMPKAPGLWVLSLALKNEAGAVLHRNFTCFLAADGESPRQEEQTESGTRLQIVRWKPDSFAEAKWSQKQWNVLDGLKVNGAGHGYFEYRIPWPEQVDAAKVRGATLIVEASAKQLFGKDREGAKDPGGDFMRGKGTHDPGSNPNSYPMTDTILWPSAVRVRINGESVRTFDLPDDPADHRGVLSWHAQLRDRKLREAGSYGYLQEVPVSGAVLAKAAENGTIVIRFEVDDTLPGGLAIYGERFGRYPVDPTLVFHSP